MSYYEDGYTNELLDRIFALSLELDRLVKMDAELRALICAYIAGTDTPEQRRLWYSITEADS